MKVILINIIMYEEKNQQQKTILNKIIIEITACRTFNTNQNVSGCCYYIMLVN